MKKLTIRLDDDLAEQLSTVAEVQDTTINAIATELLADYVGTVAKDEQFQERVEELLASRLRALQALRPAVRNREDDGGDGQ